MWNMNQNNKNKIMRKKEYFVILLLKLILLEWRKIQKLVFLLHCEKRDEYEARRNLIRSDSTKSSLRNWTAAEKSTVCFKNVQQNRFYPKMRRNEFVLARIFLSCSTLNTNLMLSLSFCSVRFVINCNLIGIDVMYITDTMYIYFANKKNYVPKIVFVCVEQ